MKNRYGHLRKVTAARSKRASSVRVRVTVDRVQEDAVARALALLEPGGREPWLGGGSEVLGAAASTPAAAHDVQPELEGDGDARHGEHEAVEQHEDAPLAECRHPLTGPGPHSGAWLSTKQRHCC